MSQVPLVDWAHVWRQLLFESIHVAPKYALGPGRMHDWVWQQYGNIVASCRNCQQRRHVQRPTITSPQCGMSVGVAPVVCGKNLATLC